MCWEGNLGLQVPRHRVHEVHEAGIRGPSRRCLRAQDGLGRWSQWQILGDPQQQRQGLDSTGWSLAWLLASLAATKAIETLEEGSFYKESDIDGLQNRIEELEHILVQERHTNLWNAYNEGFVKDGKWRHSLMSDGEWLANLNPP